MSVHGKKSYFLIPLLLWFSNALAQQIVELDPTVTPSGFIIQKLTRAGNPPQHTQGPFFFCDRVVPHPSGYQLSAYGHILLIQGDSITIKADSLHYNNTSRQVTLQGHVLFQNNRTTLTTTKLVFNPALAIVAFKDQARIVDNRTIITSQQGIYNVPLRQFTLRQHVRLVNGRSNVVVDSLRYTTTQLAVQRTPDPPIHKAKDLVALSGPAVKADIVHAIESNGKAPDTPGRHTQITAVDKNRMAAAPPKTNPVVAFNSQPSVPQELVKYAPSEALVPTPAVAQADGKLTTPTIAADLVGALSPVMGIAVAHKKSPESRVTSLASSKTFPKGNMIRTAVLTATPPATEDEQESDLERELNKKRRFK